MKQQQQQQQQQQMQPPAPPPPPQPPQQPSPPFASPGVPAFLSKLWALLGQTPSNQLITWSQVGRSPPPSPPLPARVWRSPRLHPALRSGGHQSLLGAVGLGVRVGRMENEGTAAWLGRAPAGPGRAGLS